MSCAHQKASEDRSGPFAHIPLRGTFVGSTHELDFRPSVSLYAQTKLLTRATMIFYRVSHNTTSFMADIASSNTCLRGKFVIRAPLGDAGRECHHHLIPWNFFVVLLLRVSFAWHLFHCIIIALLALSLSLARSLTLQFALYLSLSFFPFYPIV